MENISIKEIKRSNKLEVKIKYFLTIENITEITEQISSSLDNKMKISVELLDIENIDISGIQLIYAIKKAAEQKEKNFELLFKGNQEITELLKKTGFENLLITNS